MQSQLLPAGRAVESNSLCITDSLHSLVAATVNPVKHGTPQAYIAKRSASCLHDVRGFIQRGGCPRPVGPKGDQGSTAHRGTHARAVESGGRSHCAMRPVHVQVCVGLPVVALELTLASFTRLCGREWRYGVKP